MSQFLFENFYVKERELNALSLSLFAGESDRHSVMTVTSNETSACSLLLWKMNKRREKQSCSLCSFSLSLSCLSFSAMLAPLILHLDRQSIFGCRGEETQPGKESVPFKKRDDSESYVVTPKKVLYALEAGFISVLASHPHPVVCFSLPEFLAVNLKDRRRLHTHFSLQLYQRWKEKNWQRQHQQPPEILRPYFCFFFASDLYSVSSLSTSHSFHGCKE